MATSTAAPGDRQFVTALARGLDVLRCFTRERPVLGVSEIARLTGLPQPTTWRLCHTLIELGYLVQLSGGDKLRPGLPILELGFAVLAAQDFGQLARPYMQDIADRFHAGVSLGVRDGGDILFLQRCIGGSVRFANWTAGSRVPMVESSMGWACLALAPAATRARLLAAAGGSVPAALRHGMAEAIAGFERTGYIIAAGTLDPEVNSVAVPLRSSTPGHALALSCGGHASSVPRSALKSIAEALLRLAAMLELAVSPLPQYRE